MSETDEKLSQVSNVIENGALVIVSDGQRGIVENALVRGHELHYIVRMADGSLHDFEAGNVIRAKAYAQWVSPFSDWDGAERRKGERRAPQVPDQPPNERRQGDRRRP